MCEAQVSESGREERRSSGRLRQVMVKCCGSAKAEGVEGKEH